MALDQTNTVNTELPYNEVENITITDADVIYSRKYLDYVGKIQKINEFRDSLGLELITKINSNPSDADIAQIGKEFEYIKNKFRTENIMQKITKKIKEFQIRKTQKIH